MPSFYCYLLKSLHIKNSNATYVGFSTHPHKRLRQHNGENVNGALRTAKRRPWVHVVVVAGFPNKITALQFEWQWQHTQKSRILPKGDVKSTKIGVKSKLTALCILLNTSLWRQLQLTIHVVDSSSYSFLSETLSNSKAFVYLRECSPLEVKLLDDVKEFESRSILDNRLCELCNVDDKDASSCWQCENCGLVTHLLCFAQQCAGDSIVPSEIECRDCSYSKSWIEAVKTSKGGR